MVSAIAEPGSASSLRGSTQSLSQRVRRVCTGRTVRRRLSRTHVPSTASPQSANPGPNPFRVSGVVDDAHFIDRAQELTRLRAALAEPGGKLLVYGPRRMGKTSALARPAPRLVERSVPASEQPPRLVFR